MYFQNESSTLGQTFKTLIMKPLCIILLFILSISFLKAQELEHNIITGGSWEIYPWEMIHADSGNTIIHGVSEDGDFLLKVDDQTNVVWSRIIQESNQDLWNLQSKNITRASDSSFYYVTGFEQAPPINGIAIHEMNFDGKILLSESFLFAQEVSVEYVHLNDNGRLAFTMNYNNTVLYCQKEDDNYLTFFQLSTDGMPLEINAIETISDSLTILLGGTQLEQDGGFPIAIAINNNGQLEWSKQYQEKDNPYLWKAFDIFQADSINYILINQAFGNFYHSEINLETGEISNSLAMYVSETQTAGAVMPRYISSYQDNIYMKAGLNLVQLRTDDDDMLSIWNEIGVHAFEMIDSTAFHYAGALGALPVKNTSFFSEFGIKKGQNLNQIFNINFEETCEWLESLNTFSAEILTSDIDISVNYDTLVSVDLTFQFEDYGLTMENGCVRVPDNTESTNIDYTLEISPNPSTGQFHIELENEKLQQLSVYNELGSLIKTYKLLAGTTNIDLDLSTYSSGIYFVRMDMEFSSTMKKVVIQH